MPKLVDASCVSPELIEEVRTLYNSWLKPAGDTANDVLRRALIGVQDHVDASARIDPGLLQRSIIDVERAALSKLNNALTGVESITDFDQLQEKEELITRLSEYDIVEHSTHIHIEVGNQLARSWGLMK